MHIALVAEKYPPTVGGGETHLQQLAEGLAAGGHRVTVLTEPYEGPDKLRYRSTALEFVDVVGLREACQRFDCYRALPALHDALDAVHDADVVHVFNHVPALLCSLLRDEVPGALAVSLFETLIPGVRVFDLWGTYALEAALQRNLARNLRADLVVCGSEAYRRWAISAGFDDAAIAVVYFATDVDRFERAPALRDAARGTRGWSDDDFVFLVPARPVPRKGMEDTLAALAGVGDARGARLVFTAPSGRTRDDYVEKLRGLAIELGVSERIHWEEGVGWKDMVELYGAADCVILPSHYEGFGIALIEAMAASVPVVTTNIEGHDEIVVEGVTGRLYEPGDSDGLAALMQEAMRGELAALTEAARGVVAERFSVPQMVSGHAAAYDRVVAAGVRT